jgi:hypothetical protein
VSALCVCASSELKGASNALQCVCVCVRYMLCACIFTDCSSILSVLTAGTVLRASSCVYLDISVIGRCSLLAAASLTFLPSADSYCCILVLQV